MIPIIRKPTVLITIPWTTEPAIRGLAQPPTPPSPARGPGEGTLLLPAHPAPRSPRGPAMSPLCHRRSKGDASPAGHLVLHSISQGLRLLPTPLPFFPLLFFVLAWWRPCCGSSLQGISHAPNIAMPVKSKPGCLLQWSWTGTSLLRLIKTNIQPLP